jgi:peptidoglycan/LPS O-acetylase OafA/YrhL
VKTVASIQTLRALAALAVVIVHTSFVAAKYSGIREIGYVGSFGQIGVDIFFVVSGFIMYTMVRVRDLNPKEFIIDRISRIWPIYVICSFWLFGLFASWQFRSNTDTVSFPHVSSSDPSHRSGRPDHAVPFGRMDAKL